MRWASCELGSASAGIKITTTETGCKHRGTRDGHVLSHKVSLKETYINYKSRNLQIARTMTTTTMTTTTTTTTTLTTTTTMTTTMTMTTTTTMARPVVAAGAVDPAAPPQEALGCFEAHLKL